MHDTRLAEARRKFQEQLDRARVRYAISSGDKAMVLAGRILGLEEAIRIIDNLKETK